MPSAVKYWGFPYIYHFQRYYFATAASQKSQRIYRAIQWRSAITSGVWTSSFTGTAGGTTLYLRKATKTISSISETSGSIEVPYKQQAISVFSDPLRSHRKCISVVKWDKYPPRKYLHASPHSHDGLISGLKINKNPARAAFTDEARLKIVTRLPVESPPILLRIPKFNRGSVISQTRIGRNAFDWQSTWARYLGPASAELRSHRRKFLHNKNFRSV